MTLVPLLASCGGSPQGEVLAAHTSGLTTADWTPGSLPAGAVVARSSLKDPGWNLGGERIWKSNNPEIYTGDGWLSQVARNDSRRPGQALGMTGCFVAYVFHYNRSPDKLNPTQSKYIHLIATTANPTAVSVSGNKSIYTNSQKPASSTRPSGPSWYVADEWLRGTAVSFSGSVPAAGGGAYEIARAYMRPGEGVDGRVRVCVSGTASINLYSVVTTSGLLSDALNASQGAPAPGELAATPVQGSAYGREAGVYASSIVAGQTDLPVPAAPAHIGLAFNTSNWIYSFLPNQTAASVARLNDSAPQTNGNYGHKFDVTLNLQNPSTSNRNVRLYFAHTVTGSTDSPSFTYNGPAQLSWGTTTLYPDILVKPTAPRQLLQSWTLAPGQTLPVRLTLFVPGLSTANQELILESY
jgi:hypothetical protein